MEYLRLPLKNGLMPIITISQLSRVIVKAKDEDKPEPDLQDNPKIKLYFKDGSEKEVVYEGFTLEAKNLFRKHNVLVN